ncbi:MAG: hypothetical protein ABIR39_10830 [Nocardioides sp.]|uniref:hypothetical protein n=1 Tax=Nocardioides sp. TaxID=35761 RepID=UPI003264943D
MADKDPEGDGPSLELPSFGFGRKKKAKQSETAVPVEDTAPPAEPEPTPEPTVVPEPAPLAPELDPVTPAPTPVPVVPTDTAMAQTVVATPVSAEPASADPVSADPEREPVAAREKRDFTLPAIPALQAALAVGAVIGLFAVLLTFASLKLCELVRGTDSCGGPGLLLLVATLVILTYVGGWLLRGFGIDDPGSTSFLAVGLLAVLAMLFFLDVIYNWWMVIVIPLVAMGTYALSWWVTTRFVDISD